MKDKPEQIARIDGRNCFVEILDTSFPIGKVVFGFHQYDLKAEKGNRMTGNILVYMDFQKLLEVRRRVEGSGKAYVKYARNHPDYKELLFELAGGTSAESLARQGRPRADNKALARSLTVSASTKADYYLTAAEGPGKETERTHGIVFDGAPEVRIGVPIDHWTFLSILDLVVERMGAYMASRYVANPIAEHRQSNQPRENEPQAQRTPPAQPAAPKETSGAPAQPAPQTAQQPASVGSAVADDGIPWL